MKKDIINNGWAPLSAWCAAVFLLGSAVHGGVEIHPKEVGAAIDFGQIKDGTVDGADWSDQTLTRTGVYLTSSGSYDKKLDLYVTIGGLFWYPIHPGESTPERLVRFGPGVGQAQGVYSFGDPEKPSAKLQFGLFSVKYNSDATNLGEYLYRSGTYPGYIWTGGWSYINAASYLAQGVRFTLPTFDGKVVHDFTLFMERDIEPTSDFSPGYMMTVKPISFLEVGGGVVWSHALSLNPDRLSPKIRLNAYVKSTGRPLTMTDRTSPGLELNDPAIRPDGDTLLGQAVPGRNGVNYVTVAQNGTPNSALGYYTFKGFKTMGRVSLDLGTLAGFDHNRSGDFKLYSEIALLGVEDQPYYYEHKDERMPIMAGISIPTFGVLNKLAVEMEYHKSRFPNAVGAPFYESVPLPLDGASTNPFDYDFSDSTVAANKSKFEKDDLHWSVYASRKITQGVTLYAQAASDHLRHFTNPEVKPTSQPPTLKKSDWYYVVRLDFGLF